MSRIPEQQGRCEQGHCHDASAKNCLPKVLGVFASRLPANASKLPHKNFQSLSCSVVRIYNAQPPCCRKKQSSSTSHCFSLVWLSSVLERSGFSTGTTVVPVHPRLIARYDWRKEVLIIFGTGFQLLTNENSVFLLTLLLLQITHF